MKKLPLIREITMDRIAFIDTHAHLDDARFNRDRAEVLERARKKGLEAIINICLWHPREGFERGLGLLNPPFVFGSLGLHPHDASLIEDVDITAEIRRHSRRPGIVAIGETGLDYHYMNSPRELQRKAFIEHIRLARELALPLIIHSRDAEEDTLKILEDEGAEEAGGCVHCFSGSPEMAQRLVEMGFYISFTGILTFPGAEGLREVARDLPDERILMETDAPYLSPLPHRGKRSEPAFVVEVAQKLADIKGLTLTDVARITTLNAKTLFGMLQTEEPEARIAYPIRNSLYLNTTNRCNNVCTFCAKLTSYTVKGHYLKLKKEPTFFDVIRAVGDEPTKYDEIVFCGFGEPLTRLELVKKAGMYFKRMGCKIRIDTDGLANLVHRRNVLPELMFVDVLSVSLNAPDTETYQRLIKTPFGDRAYPAILWFLREAKRYIPRVVATVVSLPGLDVEACRRVAVEECGVGFRVREYNRVG